MRLGYQSCHSFIRRPNVPAALLTPFYEDVLGLPVIRPVGEMVTFWAGEDLCFEIKCDDVIRPAQDDPATAQLLPVLRTHDLEATLRRLAGHQVYPVARSESSAAQRVWVQAPDGRLVGLEERDRASRLAADVEALRRWDAGQVRLDGVGPLPPEVQYLHRIVLRVHDVERVSGFYAGVLGLDRVAEEGGCALHSLGDTVLLEIAPGGEVRDPPGDRAEVADIVITRIHDLDRFLMDMAALGVARCGETIHFETGTRAAYVCDPEGNLFGVQQRTLWGEYPEDLEADRRWRYREPAEAGPDS